MRGFGGGRNLDPDVERPMMRRRPGALRDAPAQAPEGGRRDPRPRRSATERPDNEEQ
jgi:hypothetical protein